MQRRARPFELLREEWSVISIAEKPGEQMTWLRDLVWVQVAVFIATQDSSCIPSDAHSGFSLYVMLPVRTSKERLDM